MANVQAESDPRDNLAKMVGELASAFPGEVSVTLPKSVLENKEKAAKFAKGLGEALKTAASLPGPER